MFTCSPQENKPAVLQKNPPGPTNYLIFQYLLHIWSLSNNVWSWDPSFHTEDNRGTHMQLLQKVPQSLGFFQHLLRIWSLMLQKEKQCIKSQQCKLLNRIFCLYIFIYLFSTAHQKPQKKMLACFSEDKISSVFSDLHIQNVFTTCS